MTQPTQPLLMIPGPIEVSPTVLEAFCGPPPSHVSAGVIEAFGRSIERMRTIWKATPDAQPFIVSGSGTLAMEMAAANLLSSGDRALVVNTGYFSDRMAEMLRRYDVEVIEVTAALGDGPDLEAVEAAASDGDFKALFATHVDTSTGVRVDPAPLCRIARANDMLSVFDGVCATAGEAFPMAEMDADLYLTGSQKAIGLPPGLALLVASPRAMAARDARSSKPPMSVDFHAWLPIQQAYEARKPSYFATPATNLILALDTALGEILDIDAVIERHRRVADALRATWASMGLSLLPSDPAIAANTLSAIRYPEGVDSQLVGRIKARGVIVAGGLHPACKAEYFRVGHMGYTVTQPDMLTTTITAIRDALVESGHAVEGDPVATFKAALG